MLWEGRMWSTGPWGESSRTSPALPAVTSWRRWSLAESWRISKIKAGKGQEEGECSRLNLEVNWPRQARFPVCSRSCAGCWGYCEPRSLLSGSECRGNDRHPVSGFLGFCIITLLSGLEQGWEYQAPCSVWLGRAWESFTQEWALKVNLVE